MADDEHIRTELQRMGAVFGPAQLFRTRELYEPLVSRQKWAQRRSINNIEYGKHERHKLDIYPADKGDAPVMLFVHGGGFASGDKSATANFYGNVGRYFSAHGYVGITCNYRLSGTDGWPAGSDDLAAILGWVTANITKYGGDPNNVVMLGQSAGASHVASLLLLPRYDQNSYKAVRAVALMSGHYLAQAPLDAGILQYYGENAELWAERSPLTHVRKGHLPILLTLAEFDPPFFVGQTIDFTAALKIVTGKPPLLRRFIGHNHVSTVHSLGIGDDVVGATLTEFFKPFLSS